MNVFINSLYNLLSIIPIISLFVGIFLCFLGYKIIKFLNIILGAVIGSLIGFIIGIGIFNSIYMVYILGSMLVITFIFFSILYYKYIKYFYMAILSIMLLLYLSYFILLNIPIYVYFIVSVIVVVVNYKYMYQTTVILTSLLGSTMILSYISFFSNKFMKIIFIIVLAFLGGLIQRYLNKIKEKSNVKL